MLKKQLIFILTGLALVILLFIFGTTVAPKSKSGPPAISAVKTFDIHNFINEEKKHLSTSQVINLGKLENSVTRGDVNSQLIIANTQLANFWKDSARSFEPYFYYLSEAAKLDKSEKNLTFAAQLILQNLRGEEDEDNNMNWKRVGTNLIPEQDEQVLISDKSMLDNDFPVKPDFLMNELKLYKTLNEEVYYYNKKMTIREIVDTINRYTKKVFIDTVYTWPKELANLPKETRLDTNFLLSVYGPPKQFYLKTYKGQQHEKERLAKQEAIKDSMLAKWQPQSLSGQIQKYYQPSSLTALGWINCDRFYKFREQTDVEADLPVTLNNSNIQFFLLFKSMNGLMNLNTEITDSKKRIFRSLPIGESVTLIGFTKNNGQIFHCREEFVILKNKPVLLKFTNISPEEMIKIFGKNVKI